MTDAATTDDVERELGRVVDRLNSLPLAKAGLAAPEVRLAGEQLLEQTRLLDPAIPKDVDLPILEPQGLGALIAVLGNDWLQAARTTDDADCSAVLDALVALRRALP